jgi:5-methyltetrahydrofolate--homocysteine methyltransferase
MIPFQERLRQPGIILADGAMGTMLLERGVKPGDCPERINIDNPALLEEITRRYHAAGAEIVQTNTFGGSPLQLSRHGLESRTEEINARAVAAARRVVSDRAYVSASFGPSGRILEPYGDAAEEMVFDSFRTQAAALIAEGVDIVCVETMIDLAEAVLAIRAVRSISASIPIIATMTFENTPRGFFTVMGTDIPGAAGGLSAAGADIVGANCGNGIATMALIAREFRACGAIPVAVRANAGIPRMEDGKPVYPESPAFMAEESRAISALGVKIIGGCCGTTPEHVAELRRIIGPPR